MPVNLWITGITGSVGSEIVRWLYRWAPDLHVTAILRAASPRELRIRWNQALLAAGVPASDPWDVRRRWRPLAGDITLPNLGMSHLEIAAQCKEVTHIIHAAADVRLGAPLQDLERVNCEGTQNVLAFASKCSRLIQCGCISTLFVAGRRSGTIQEHELEHDAGFINNYERSKYLAELVARGFMDVLPLAVYRLALLPGRFEDGFVHQYGAFHQVLDYYHRGLLRMLPGDPGNRLDMVPTDWATDVLMRMFLRHFEPNHTFHLGGGDRAVSMGEFVALTNRCFSALHAGRGQRAASPLELVSPSTYHRLQKSASRAAGSDRLARMLDSALPYGVFSRVFDTRGVQASLNPAPPAPEFEEYFPRIVERCLQTDWGKRTAAVSPREQAALQVEPC